MTDETITAPAEPEAPTAPDPVPAEPETPAIPDAPPTEPDVTTPDTTPAVPEEGAAGDMLPESTAPIEGGILDELTPLPMETMAVVAAPEPRPFLTTPFEKYNVSEGLLVIIVLLLFFGFLYDVIKEAF